MIKVMLYSKHTTVQTVVNEAHYGMTTSKFMFDCIQIYTNY